MPCDYKNYPKNWKSIRNEILERAENRCECAGECMGLQHLQGDVFSAGLGKIQVKIKLRRCIEMHMQKPQTFGGRRVILTIAHTNKSRNTKCARRDKLKAMCQACHLRFDRNHKKARIENGN